jgi:high-affinity iron transporter
MKFVSMFAFIFLSLSISGFFQSGHAAPAKAKAVKAPPVNPQLLEKGKASFAMNCVLCHGEKGDGNGPAGAAMNPKPRNFVTEKFKAGDSVEKIFEVTTNGLKDTSMAGYSFLPEEERWALAYYVRTFRPAKK